MALYFNWLQKDVPTGPVEVFPELDDSYRSSVPGMYCIGDITGIPLIRLAAESGKKVMEQIADDIKNDNNRNSSDQQQYDLVIIGAGPAGLSAALEAQKRGFSYVVLEANRVFNTIENFPYQKPIIVTPEGTPDSELRFSDGTKESLLEQLHHAIEDKDIAIECPVKVQKVEKQQDGSFVTICNDGKKYNGKRVLVAIGKSGNPRHLGVDGEDKEHVFHRLIDPRNHKEESVVVVGGGDSAIEAAVALAKAGNTVHLSYRKSQLSRAKQSNASAFKEQVDKGAITPHFQTEVQKIEDEVVRLKGEGARKNDTIKASSVYVLIGTEFPFSFFQKSGIAMEGTRDTAWKIQLTAMVSFFTMLYFGKSGSSYNLFDTSESIWQLLLSYIQVPFTVTKSWTIEGYGWYPSINFYLGWIGSVVFIVSGIAALVVLVKRRDRMFSSTWSYIKYGYFIIVSLWYTYLYFVAIFSTNNGWSEELTYWYSLLYTTTILLFGARRIQKKPTRYITLQTATFSFIQLFFLFLLPFYLYDPMVAPLLGGSGSYWNEQLFPDGKWSSFGYILFWPLNINNFGTSTFWTWFPFVQSFLILGYIVYRWGKGVYCGWICSCGAMAESLGDEYRHLAPHGPTAKNMENIGQVILWFAFVATGLHYAHVQGWFGSSTVADTTWGIYKLLIDVFFAGVLGLGVYFFFGGRIWCRYGCPLAALMHIYARFSPYRILSLKKRCINCNICTKVCHMGIDVMNYANKGVPMNDVECVRCSACVVNCPMQVLSFGSVGKVDLQNTRYRHLGEPKSFDWTSGLPREDISMLNNVMQKSD